jgi:uncharacterized protein DUF2793/C1q domain-containing protein
MVTDTPNLKMPYIAASQAQKHVTHNEALRVLDAVVQLSVIDRDLSTPPTTPADGDRYIVGPSATGAWATHDGEIAAWQDNSWIFHAPKEGWISWIDDENVALGYDGTVWAGIVTGASVNPTSLVGVNATADATNRLSVVSPATLFNHDGNGHQLKINKNTAADTASILYQSGFGGRAEIGLVGDDDFTFKVSPDGSTFFSGLVIDKDTGIVTQPNKPQFMVDGGALPTATSGTFNLGQGKTPSLDIGNHFDAVAGEFVTPIQGNYFFEAQMISSGLTTHNLQILFAKNSVSVGIRTLNYLNVFTTSSNMLRIALAKNDRIAAQVVFANSASSGVWGSSFSGGLA